MLLFQNYVMSQGFLEVKYSINDITTQRNNFRQEKIKTVIMKIDFKMMRFCKMLIKKMQPFQNMPPATRLQQDYK